VLFAAKPTSATVLVHGHAVRGVDVDETGCAHNGTERDVVAIRSPCCDTFYPCHRCYVMSSTKTPSGGPWGTRGARGAELAIQAYIGVSACPDRGIRFNPGCADHHDRYVETTADATEYA
jgi:uncharacterized CHY-type Zn-finger protein